MKILKGAIILFILVGVIIGRVTDCVSAQGATTTGEKFNVILVLIETLRPDHMGCYGYVKDTTSNIDALSREAVLFQNAYAQAPCTLPSVWNILTSRYKANHYVMRDNITLAEYLESLGYKTAAFLSQIHLSKENNFHLGFDLFDSDAERTQDRSQVRPASVLTDAAIEWLKQNKKERFFMWMHYYDPHDPYIPPAGFKGYYNKKETRFSGDRIKDGIKGAGNRISKDHEDFLINAYDEEIHYMDDQMGRLQKWLKQEGIYDETVIIITSDHGEELNDNDNRWGHCQTLSEEEIRVPLIMKLPRQSRSVTIEDIVQTIDIYPTLVRLLSADRLPDHFETLQGDNLIPLIREQRKQKEAGVAKSFWKGSECVIFGNYKYMKDQGGETLRDLEGGRVAEDKDLMRKFRNMREGTDPKEYEYFVNDLRSLGYLQ